MPELLHKELLGLAHGPLLALSCLPSWLRARGR